MGYVWMALCLAAIVGALVWLWYLVAPDMWKRPD
jgi:uncharacterized protein YjeT (DUF2065 family)